MEVSKQPKLKFHGVDFPIVNLNSTKFFKYNGEQQISIKVKPQVFYPKDKTNYFRIIQEVNLTVEGHFELVVLGVGNFEIDTELDDVIKKNFVNVNAPAIMFPYIRSFITTLTANLGNVTGALIIPTQFFNGELEEMPDDPNDENSEMN